MSVMLDIFRKHIEYRLTRPTIDVASALEVVNRLGAYQIYKGGNALLEGILAEDNLSSQLISNAWEGVVINFKARQKDSAVDPLQRTIGSSTQELELRNAQALFAAAIIMRNPQPPQYVGSLNPALRAKWPQLRTSMIRHVHRDSATAMKPEDQTALRNFLWNNYASTVISRSFNEVIPVVAREARR